MSGRRLLVIGLLCSAAGAILAKQLITPGSEKAQPSVGANAPEVGFAPPPLVAPSPPPETPSSPEAAQAPAARLPVTLSDSGPEAQLARIYTEIEANRLGDALQLTESLLLQHPNYRLAHLIKGDLLLARARPIQSFGAMDGAPADKVSDLQAEAVARLKGYREKPEANFVPRYLLQMPPDQRYAVVVDTKRSRLYLYENDVANGGRPRFVADYYVTQGKLGADKISEGDKKTPVGVYHVTGNLRTLAPRSPPPHPTPRPLSNQMPAPRPTAPVTGRQRHLAAWNAVRHFLAPAQSIRRLRRAHQPGS